MTKALSALAGVLFAASAMTSTAEAGGVRLSFGGPLGSFTAHERLSDGPAGTARYSRRCAEKPSAPKPYSVARHRDDDDTPARRSVRKTPKVEVAEQTPVRRKPKVEMEKPEARPVVKTAKLEDKTVATDVAPSVTVPETPVAPQITQPSLTSIADRTASLETAPITVPAVAPDADPKNTATATEVATAPAPVAVQPVVETPKPVKAAKETKGKQEANRTCKRFSAAVAGLVDAPCQ